MGVATLTNHEEKSGRLFYTVKFMAVSRKSRYKPLLN